MLAVGVLVLEDELDASLLELEVPPRRDANRGPDRIPPQRAVGGELDLDVRLRPEEHEADRIPAAFTGRIGHLAELEVPR